MWLPGPELSGLAAARRTLHLCAQMERYSMDAPTDTGRPAIAVFPVLDLVVVHKTRPGQGRSVTHQQFLAVLDVLVKADCRNRRC